MAWADIGVGGRVGKQPAAPTTQPNYWLGDVSSDSGLKAGSADAKAAQGALENPYIPESKTVLSDIVNRNPQFGTSLANTLGIAPKYSFESDPGVALARALENQGISQLDSWLKAAREQAIIQSGDPALAQMAGFGLDPQAGVFAQQNYLSGNADLARVDRARKLAKKAIIDRLAARGLLRSGDLGYLEGQANIDFGNQEYDVRQTVLKKLADLMAQYLQQKQSLKQSTVGAYQNAFNSVSSNPGLLNSISAQALKEFLNT